MNIDSLPSASTPGVAGSAELLKDAGYAVNMRYGTDGSSPADYNLTYASLNHHFNYTAGSRVLGNHYASEYEWYDSLRAEISHRPVLFTVSNLVGYTEGHAMVMYEYNSSNNSYLINIGWSNRRVKWYTQNNINTQLNTYDKQEIVKYIIPDRVADALPLPFKEDFENTGVHKEIPRFLGVSESGTIDNNINSNSPDNKFYSIDLFSTPYKNGSLTLKKINLNGSVNPVLKFKFCLRNTTEFSENDTLSVKISVDNRETWQTIYEVNRNEYNKFPALYSNNFFNEAISLRNYIGQTANIKICFGSNNRLMLGIDDIEVGNLGLEFSNLTDKQVLTPKNEQNIAVKIITTGNLKKNTDRSVVLDYYIKKDSTGVEYSDTPNFTDSTAYWSYLSDETLSGAFSFPKWNTSKFYGKKYRIRAVAREEADLETILAEKEITVNFAPLDRVSTDGTPKNKSSAIIVKSKITEFDGVTDYPVNRVEFFVKKQNESSYSPISGTVNANGVNPKYYWTEWNGFATGQGNYSLKSRAYYTVDGHTMTVTDSLELELPKAYCEIISPLPDEVVDLHYEKGFGFDLKGEEYLTPGFHLGLAIINEQGVNVLQKVAGDKNFISKLGCKEASPMKPNWKLSPNFKSGSSKGYAFATLDEGIQSQLKGLHGLNLYPTQFYPGKYQLWCAVYNADITAYEALPESIYFRIPSWSFHLLDLGAASVGNNNYIPKLNYRRGEIVQMGLYRDSAFTKTVSVEITNETGNIVHSFDLPENNDYYHEWQTNASMPPGFYKLTGREKDSTGAVMVTQEQTIQLAPLYVDFENNGYWPNEWPGSDTHNWKLHTSGNWNAYLGYHSMAAHYETKDHTTFSALEHSGVTLEPNREYEVIYSLGIWKNAGVNNFDPLYADYSLEVKRGGEWLTVKTIDPNQYLNTPWPSGGIYCLMQDKFNLGISSTEPVKVRLVQRGKSSLFTPQDQPQLNKVQEVLYDNITIAYKKSSGVSSPSGLTVVPVGDGKAKLSWQHNNNKADYQIFEKFKIYKNGILAGETVNKELTDNTVNANSVYSYAVTAVYRNKDTPAVTETPRTNCMTNYSSYWTLPFNESFEGGALPGSWKSNMLNPQAGTWTVIDNQTAGYNAQSGNYMIRYAKSGQQSADTVRLETPFISLSSTQYPVMSMWTKKTATNNKSENCLLQIQVKTENSDWINVGAPVNYESSAWFPKTTELVQYQGMKVKIGFKLIASGTPSISIDNLEIKDTDGSIITYNGTHNINSNLVIPENKTLILQPGTKLLFAEGVSLQVNGKMVADGSMGKITLASQTVGKNWKGINGNGSNIINLKNVDISDAISAVNQFSDVLIDSCKITNSIAAIEIYDADSVEIKNSAISECKVGVSINRAIEQTSSQIVLKNNMLVNSAPTGKVGFDICYSENRLSVVSGNKINGYQYGINLYYSNASFQNNEISNGVCGIMIFESSPVIHDNNIHNNSYGIYTVGYAAPILNQFASSGVEGGYNRIYNNSIYQIYYDNNNYISLDGGHNDIYATSTTNQLVFACKYTSSLAYEDIWATENYWGTLFNPEQPARFFEPYSIFNFDPYSTEPNVVENMKNDVPADDVLDKFDLALKKEINQDYAAANELYLSLLSELPNNATKILPRAGYTGTSSKVSSIYSQIHDKKLISDFTYYSFIAREAFHNGNEQSAADFYHLKLDSSEINNDSLIAKINLLDLYWSVNQKGKVKLSRQLKDLVCKDAKEYAAKREKLLAELLGTPTGIATDNTVKDFSLFQNYPNPFNPATSIKYALPEAGNVKIKIYNLAGALVSEINEGTRKTGYHTTHFNGNQLASGVYIYLLEFNGNVMMTKKMVMLK